MKKERTTEQNIQAAEPFEIVGAIASQSKTKLQNLVRIATNKLHELKKS